MDFVKRSAAGKLKHLLILFSLTVIFIKGNAQGCENCRFIHVTYVSYGNITTDGCILSCSFDPGPTPDQFETRRSGEANRWKDPNHHPLFEEGMIIKKNGDTLRCLVDIGLYMEVVSYIEYKLGANKRVKAISIGRIKNITSTSGNPILVERLKSTASGKNKDHRKGGGWIWNMD